MPQCIPHYSALSAILPLVTSTNWRTKIEECHLLLKIITHDTTAVIVIESLLSSLSLWHGEAGWGLLLQHWIWLRPQTHWHKNLCRKKEIHLKHKASPNEPKVMATGSKYYNQWYIQSLTFTNVPFMPAAQHRRVMHGTTVPDSLSVHSSSFISLNG